MRTTRAIVVLVSGVVAAAILAVVGMLMISWSLFPEMRQYGCFLLVASGTVLYVAPIAAFCSVVCQ